MVKHAVLTGVTNNPAYAVSETVYEADHLSPDFDVTVVAAVNAAVTPAAASAAANAELYSVGKSTRRVLDLRNVTQVRLTGLIIANGNVPAASYKLSYMTTLASTWAGTDTGATLTLGTGTAGALRVGAWANLPVAAQIQDCALAVLVGIALGTTPPTISSLSIQYR